MVKLERFEIELSRKNGVYFPGEEVTGNVAIKLKEPSPKKTRIFVEFRGETHVEMTKMKRLRSDTHSIFQNKFELENDNYEFKFSLPSSGLATSYEHPQAYIQYWLRASIWSTQTYVIKRFTVINPLDLNLLTGLRQPYGVSDSTTVCCCPCESDPITVEFNTHKTGYVSGETILFNATIDNRSSKSIKSISMLLYQHTRFSAQGFTSEFSLHYLSLIYNGPKIGPRMKGEWSSNDNVGLKIPIVCPSLLDTCPFIRLFYTIALEVKFNGAENICLDIPIVIGTVPLLNDSKLSFESSSIKFYKPKWDRIRTIEEIIEEQENENRRAVKNDVNDINDSRFLSRYPYYTDFSNVFK